MQDRAITNKEWKNFFDSLSKSAKNNQIELEVSGFDIGYQVEGDWLDFEGISYEPRLDTIHIHTSRIEHAIIHPLEVIVALEHDAIVSLEIKDDDRTQILNFRPPVVLKEPSPREIHP